MLGVLLFHAGPPARWHACYLLTFAGPHFTYFTTLLQGTGGENIQKSQHKNQIGSAPHGCVTATATCCVTAAVACVDVIAVNENVTY